MATPPAPASAAATEITTDLWVYQDGDTVTVTGIDFGPNEVVDFVTTDPNGVLVDTGSATTDATGGVVYPFVLHATVTGIYDVIATGETSGLTAVTQFDPARRWDLSVSASPASLVVTTGSIRVTGTLALSGSDCTAPISPVGKSIQISVSNGGAFVPVNPAVTTGAGGSYSLVYTPLAKGPTSSRPPLATTPTGLRAAETGASRQSQ